LQLFTDLNPENSRYTTIGPLMAVLILSMTKQAVEDAKRHRADNKMNSRDAIRINANGHPETIPWHRVQMGDIIQIKDRQEFPADCVIIASSDVDGKCFTETANLDGETNLKRRIAITETHDFITGRTNRQSGGEEGQRRNASRLKGQMEYERPNSRLYNFSGRITLSEVPEPLPVFPDNIILRGCMLRSCQYVYGLVVYTGGQTKIMNNLKPAPLKQSNIYKMVNKCVALTFAILLIMMIFSSINFSMWNSKNKHVSYIFSKDGNSQTNASTLSNALLSLLTFLMLYANLVPISLYVSMDLIKVVQASLIEKDPHMIHRGTTAKARTSDLNEDLGQIEYIFSDKTGTLTCNMMEFRKCYIQGISYGFGTTEIGRAAARRIKALSPAEESDTMSNKGAKSLAQVILDPSISFDDPRLLEHLRDYNSKQSHAVHEFLTLLAVCHTVIPETTSNGGIAYRAASPDEEALVKAARCLGYNVKSAAPIIDIEVSATTKTFDMKYQVMAVNEFTSTRKRMSSLVKSPSGEYILYCKGADNVIIERCITEENHDHMVRALKDFACEGLRTLVCSKRVIPEREAIEWLAEYSQAMSSISNRDEKLVQVAEKIEIDMTIVGCTAIEDKLQDGVPVSSC
jgi:phospholipid-transporting ATPase